MRILGIDPGTLHTGWAILQDGKVAESGVADNEQLLYGLNLLEADYMAIEIFEARGMPIGRESIETILYTGMLMQAWNGPKHAMRVKRSDVKLHLCGTARAKDANIRQALIDRLGAPGTKKAPGGTYGVTSHAWAALGVALTAADKIGGRA